MKRLLLTMLFASLVLINAEAQKEQNNFQSDELVRMGIVRMVTREVIQPYVQNKPEEIKISETFFDAKGRIVRIENDDCNECITVQEYDTLTGRVSYVSNTRRNSFGKVFFKYDDLSRRISAEYCKDRQEDACQLYTYVFDEEDKARVYYTLHKRQTSVDATKKPKRFHRIYSENEAKTQLVQENTFTPKGQIAEIRYLQDEKFEYGWTYEYDSQGKLSKIWYFDDKIRQVRQENLRNEDGRVMTRKTYGYSPGDPDHTLSEPSLQTFEYDEDGLLIKTSTAKTTTEYTYFKE